MQVLKHRNIVEMKNSFYTNGDKPDEIYLNLVLEYVPDTVYRYTCQHTLNKQFVPMIYVKVYKNTHMKKKS